MAAELVYDPAKGLGTLDRILVKGAAARKSGVEIAAMTNGLVTAEQAMDRVLDIIASRDWLSQAQAKMLLVDDMMAVKDHLMKQVIDYRDSKANAGLVSILTLLEKTLASEKIDLERAMKEISAAHGQLMLTAISIALERSFLELEKRYPDMQKSVLLEVFQDAMPPVVKEIEARVSK
jgi:hypothetical protein